MARAAELFVVHPWRATGTGVVPMATLPTTVLLRRWWQRFLDVLPDVHARLFISAAGTGFVAALAGTVANYLNDGGPGLVTLTFGLAAVSLAMIWFAKITGRYELARVVTMIIVFLVIFPYMFFIGGGYHSGMPAMLVFGMGSTALALVGRTLWVLLGLEFATYSACCLAAYGAPQLVTPLSGTELVADVIICVAIAGFAPSTMVHLPLRVHERNASLLAAKNAELQEIDRERSELLAMVAHELDTPSAVMRVHLDEAASSGIAAPASMQHTVGVMTAENERLTRLAGQLRDVSRVGSGRMDLDLQVEDLSVIIQEVLRTYRPLVNRNGNVVELARGGAHPQVRVDRERVAQVLVNLPSNAARHTTDGTISVAVRDRGEFAQVIVSDTGEGFPVDVQRHLCERIGRPSSTGIRSSRDAGLGLGPVISRHIMHTHGGDLRIESTPGIGTTASLTFLLARSPVTLGR